MTAQHHPKGAPWRNFHGRIKGKALRPNQEAWLDEDLGPPTAAELRALRLQAAAAIDQCHLFGDYRKTIVDTRQSSVNCATPLTCNVGGTAAAATSFV